MQREASMDSVIDRDIEHIRASILHSLDEAPHRSALTLPYWRRRLCGVMNLHHLSRAQLAQTHAILAILDRVAPVPQVLQRDGNHIHK
jgi:hypothetical protein